MIANGCKGDHAAALDRHNSKASKTSSVFDQVR